MSVSHPHRSACIAGQRRAAHRTASRGRSATESGYAHRCEKALSDRAAGPLTRSTAGGRTSRGDWTGVSRSNLAACVVGNDAPLIGERAATRGRCTTASGDEQAGTKTALSVRAPARKQPRRATRPGTRTLVDDLPADWEGMLGGGTWVPHRWALSFSLANRNEPREPRCVGTRSSSRRLRHGKRETRTLTAP